MYAPIRIVIADDHEIFRNGFKLLLKDQPLIELVGDAANGKELLLLAKEAQPDVVFMDINMPVMDGIEATKQLSKAAPDTGIIALSTFNEDSLIVDMLEAGARGYLLKNTNKAELFTAAKAVHEGGTYYCAATSSRLQKLIVQSGFNPYKHKPKPSFSQRELEVIDLICKEYTTKEIAGQLGLSNRTVESYRENILEKTGAKNFVGVVVYAFKNKLVDYNK